MSRISYLNNQFLPHENCLIHIEDRGFQFADGVYEVTLFENGKLIDGEAHMERVAVGVRIDGDGLEPRVLAGPDDPDGDLAAVGDQDGMHVVRTLSVVAGRQTREAHVAAYRLWGADGPPGTMAKATGRSR